MSERAAATTKKWQAGKCGLPFFLVKKNGLSLAPARNGIFKRDKILKLNFLSCVTENVIFLVLTAFCRPGLFPVRRTDLKLYVPKLNSL